MSDALSSSPARGSAIGAALVVGFAFVGFVAGTRDPQGSGRPDVVAPAAAASPPSRGAPMVPRYRDLATTRRGDSVYYGSGLAGFAVPASTASVERRPQAVLARTQRRAYEGAPPTIPHPVEQQAAPACLACHEQGLAIGGKVARAMSHGPQQSCVQCHVPSADPRPLAASGQGTASSSSSFVGLSSSGAGPRAWPGAPPQIPHAAFMRERCASCHGLAGHEGLRAQHDPRSSCLQCHVSVGDRLPQAYPRSAP